MKPENPTGVSVSHSESINIDAGQDFEQSWYTYNEKQDHEVKKVRTSLALPRELLRDLDEEAAKLGLSRSAYVTSLLMAREQQCTSGIKYERRATDK